MRALRSTAIPSGEMGSRFDPSRSRSGTGIRLKVAPGPEIQPKLLPSEAGEGARTIVSVHLELLAAGQIERVGSAAAVTRAQYFLRTAAAACGSAQPGQSVLCCRFHAGKGKSQPGQR
jgi:hypothetical protein